MSAFFRFVGRIRASDVGWYVVLLLVLVLAVVLVVVHLVVRVLVLSPAPVQIGYLFDYSLESPPHPANLVA